LCDVVSTSTQLDTSSVSTYVTHFNLHPTNARRRYNSDWKKETAAIIFNGTFLKNEAIECDGVKIFGKGFFWNMKTTNPYDELIPSGTDVIIAHNPAKGYVDGGHGCPSSAATCAAIKPRAYICGHVHSAKGVVQGRGKCAATVFVNGASVLGDHKAAAAQVFADGGGLNDPSMYAINGAPIVIRI
jgi:Icc-related predicted phosphoesterase